MSKDAIERAKRLYKTTDLPTLRDEVIDMANEKYDRLWKLYDYAFSNWQMLVDIRFKLLSLTPPVSILSIKELNDVKDGSIKLVLAFLGLVVTVAIYIYEKRNTELHDDLISRMRKIEQELSIDTGQFLGRLKPTKLIKHDIALNLIYGSAILSWIIFIGSLIEL